MTYFYAFAVNVYCDFGFSSLTFKYNVSSIHLILLFYMDAGTF